MAEAKIKYSIAKSVAITLAALTDGSFRQSLVVDNSSDLFIDAHLGGSIQVGSAPIAGNLIKIYAYGTYDGTNYTAGCSGADAGYTADGEEDLLRLVATIEIDGTANQYYVFGPISIADAFGGKLPQKWGIVVENNSGSALNATGTNNEVQFLGITFTSS